MWSDSWKLWTLFTLVRMVDRGGTLCAHFNCNIIRVQEKNQAKVLSSQHSLILVRRSKMEGWSAHEWKAKFEDPLFKSYPRDGITFDQASQGRVFMICRSLQWFLLRPVTYFWSIYRGPHWDLYYYPVDNKRAKIPELAQGISELACMSNWEWCFPVTVRSSNGRAALPSGGEEWQQQ